MHGPVLSLTNLRKEFGGNVAIHDFSLEVYPGEIVALVGDNGAGKTTLVKCLSGVLRPDSGSILIDGTAHDQLTAELARTLGIETVYQNLSLIDTLDVMQNFFLNRELYYNNPLAQSLRWLNRRRMYRVTDEHLRALGLPVEARRQVSALSGGQRQMIAVGRAIGMVAGSAPRCPCKASRCARARASSGWRPTRLARTSPRWPRSTAPPEAR